MSQELREAQNVVNVEGILMENRLEQRDKDGKDYIAGDLLVKTAEDNIVAVNFFSFAVKKDGGQNQIYKSLSTVKDNYKSAAKFGPDEADKVKIGGGRIESNEFYAANGRLISTFRIRSNFVNRVSGDFNPGIDFQVEAYIQGMVEEIDKEEPTGRLMVKGVVPMYGGKISLLTFFVEDTGGIKYIQDNYTVGDTVKLAGTINNNIQVIEKTEEMEFGDDIVTTFERVKRELIVTRGSKPYDEKAFEVEAIKQAMGQREVHLNNLKSKSEQTAVTGGKGGGFGGKTPF